MRKALGSLWVCGEHCEENRNSKLSSKNGDKFKILVNKEHVVFTYEMHVVWSLMAAIGPNNSRESLLWAGADSIGSVLKEINRVRGRCLVPH
jgi:hypothetical protein